MRLSKVKIRNFKSIEKIEFSVSNLCVLIGENNAGKSNILEALDLLLNSEKWPLNTELKPTDFFNRNINKPIEIMAWFDNLDEEELNHFSRPHRNVMMQHYKKVKKREKRKQEALGIGLFLYFDNPEKSLYCFIDRNGQPIYYGNNQIRKISSEDRKFFHFVYIPPLRDVGKEFAGYSWNIWNKLLKSILRDLDENIKDQIKKSFNESSKILRNTQLKELEEDLKQFTAELLPKNEADLEVEISPFDMDDLYKNSEIYISDPIRTTIAEKGMGIQSSVIVALYRVYAKWSQKPTIFGIEEPELFLHPHNLRLLYSTFEDIVKKGSTIIFATHSPLLVRYDKPSKIVIVRKDSQKSTRTFQITDQRFEELQYQGLVNSSKIGRFFNPTRNEIFFARKVIIVEGDTDRYGFVEILTRFFDDLDKLGISVIEVGGKTNLVDFATILKELEIPCIVIFDEDRDNKNLKNGKSVNEYLKEVSEYSVVFSPNLESVFLRKNKTLICDYLKKKIGEKRIKKTISNYQKEGKSEEKAYIFLLKNAEEVKVQWLRDIAEIISKEELPKEIKELLDYLKL